MITPFDLYKQYVAIKKHFTYDKYDYFKYHGKLKINNLSFAKRKDKFKFQQLLNKFKFKNENDSLDFLVANIISDCLWIGDMIDQNSYHRYLEFKKRKESITYYFKNDMEKINSDLTPFKYSRNSYPPIIYKLISGDIDITSFSILDHYVCFMNKMIIGHEDDIIITKIFRKTKKILPFLSWDDEKIKKIINKTFFQDKKA